MGHNDIEAQQGPMVWAGSRKLLIIAISALGNTLLRPRVKARVQNPSQMVFGSQMTVLFGNIHMLRMFVAAAHLM